MTNSSDGFAPHPYVGGRAAALRELAAWRAGAARAPRVVVLTGSPGAGASRLMTGFLMLCDPEFRATLPLADLDPSTVPPDLPAPATPSAQGLTASQVLWLLSDHHELDATRAEDVFTALAALDAPVTVAVPDVDLAGPVRATGEPARLVREVLRPLAATPTVRLLTEVPRDLVTDLVGGLPEGVARVLDLDDPRWADPDGLVLQVATALDPALGAPELVWTQDPESRDEVARAVARSAGGNRLTARLAVESLLTAPEGFDPDTLDAAGKSGLPADVAEALDGHAARLGTDPVLLRAVLAPLAFAEGEGLPVQLWAPLAGAIAGTDLSAVLADAARLAGPFVHLAEAETEPATDTGTDPAAGAAGDAAAREPAAGDAEAPDGGPRVLARLTHPAIAAELRAGLDVATTQRRVASALLAAVPEQDWTRADPYVRDHLAAHTLEAGLLPRLLTDPALFVHADPVVLRAAVEAVPPETLDPPARTYLRTAPLLTRAEAPAPIRAALLETAFVQDGLPRFAEALHTLGLGLPWRTLWSAPVAGVTGVTVGSAALGAPASEAPAGPDTDATAAPLPGPRTAPDEAAPEEAAPGGASPMAPADGVPVGVLVVPPGTPGAHRLADAEAEVLVLGLAGAEVLDVDPARVSRLSEEDRAAAALAVSRGADYVRIWDRGAEELVAALFSDVPFTAVDLSPDGVLLVATERGVTALDLRRDRPGA